MMTPRPHQLEDSEKLFTILKKYGMAYLAAQERTGKTLTAILTAEKCSKVHTVLVLTKKKAIAGWYDTLNQIETDRVFFVTNYDQIYKLRTKPDLVILDEAHAYLSTFPKLGKLAKAVRAHIERLPTIYLSATPYAQGAQQLYSQFSICSFSPWRTAGPFPWFHKYGIPSQAMTTYGLKPVYTKTKTAEAIADVKHLFVYRSRAELGFEQEPVDKLHYVQLAEQTVEWLKIADQKRHLFDIKMETDTKLRTIKHQLEGGTISDVHQELNSKGKPKAVKDRTILANHEKVDYIKGVWGDTTDMAIMYYYQAELEKLQAHFKHAELLQGSTNAEGVDLHHVEHLIIYSQNYSTSQHVQRRARQANLKRESPIIVHHLLVKGGLSEKVYKKNLSNKTKYIDTMRDML